MLIIFGMVDVSLLLCLMSLKGSFVLINEKESWFVNCITFGALKNMSRVFISLILTANFVQADFFMPSWWS